MKCSACGVHAEFEDGFCSACGVEQQTSRLPVKRDPSPVPAAWRQAAPVVARGAALVAAGIAAEWILRSLARGAVSTPAPRRSEPKPVAVSPQQTVLVEEVVAVSRTVVRRRIIARK